MNESKERKLLELMTRHYSSLPNRGWVSMELILLETSMSSFNQRFQEWRQRGIVIENRIIDGLSEYKLFTHPQDIEIETIGCKAIQMELSV